MLHMSSAREPLLGPVGGDVFLPADPHAHARESFPGGLLQCASSGGVTICIDLDQSKMVLTWGAETHVYTDLESRRIEITGVHQPNELPIFDFVGYRPHAGSSGKFLGALCCESGEERLRVVLDTNTLGRNRSGIILGAKGKARFEVTRHSSRGMWGRSEYTVQSGKLAWRSAHAHGGSVVSF